MPFSGGGGGALPAHVHNSVPLQGGPLDFVNDTISSMNAGSTTFSNGAALQELVIGNAGESMVVNPAGTAPEWGSGGGAWSKVGSDSGDQAALNVTGISGGDIFHIFYNLEPSTLTTTAYPRMRINSVSSASYDCCLQNQYVTGATALEWNQTATGFFLGHEDGHNSQYQYCGDIYLQKIPTSQESNGYFMTLRGLTYRNDSAQMSYIIYGGGYQPDTNDITDISFTMSSGNISGTIQVNSLTYS
tara:strand:- start:533 stop:1267 length:735 start_codon:yes stop_codon:yes gene_type:complete